MTASSGKEPWINAGVDPGASQRRAERAFLEVGFKHNPGASCKIINSSGGSESGIHGLVTMGFGR